MKKIASIVLAVLVVFSMFTFMATAATPTLSFKADKTTIAAGDEVKVTVSVSKESGLCALDLELSYDNFELVSFAANAKSGLNLIENTTVAGKIKVSGAAATSMPADETLLFTVVLKATSNAGKISLNVNEAYVADGIDEIDITADFVAAPIVFTAPVVPDEPSTKPVDPSEHDCEYSKPIVTKKATCKEPGVQELKCKICGDSIKEAIPVDPDAHKAGAWEVTKAATTTSTGTKVQKCKYCGEVLKTEKIAKLPSDELTNPAIPNTDAIA